MNQQTLDTVIRTIDNMDSRISDAFKDSAIQYWVARAYFFDDGLQPSMEQLREPEEQLRKQFRILAHFEGNPEGFSQWYRTFISTEFRDLERRLQQQRTDPSNPSESKEAEQKLRDMSRTRRFYRDTLLSELNGSFASDPISVMPLVEDPVIIQSKENMSEDGFVIRLGCLYGETNFIPVFVKRPSENGGGRRETEIQSHLATLFPDSYVDEIALTFGLATYPEYSSTFKDIFRSDKTTKEKRNWILQGLRVATRVNLDMYLAINNKKYAESKPYRHQVALQEICRDLQKRVYTEKHCREKLLVEKFLYRSRALAQSGDPWDSDAIAEAKRYYIEENTRALAAMHRIADKLVPPVVAMPYVPVHGDLHAGNIFISREGVIKLHDPKLEYGPLQVDYCRLLDAGHLANKDVSRVITALSNDVQRFFQDSAEHLDIPLSDIAFPSMLREGKLLPQNEYARVFQQEYNAVSNLMRLQNVPRPFRQSQ